jgi:hypothetical protein
MAGTATGYYNLLDKLKETLEADKSINTVSYGDIYEIANNKSTMWPIANFSVESTEMTDRTYIFRMSLTIADLIDQTNESADDKFRGKDNIMDIHNTSLASLSNALLLFKRKDAIAEGYVLVGNPNLEPFTHSFNDDTAGWHATFTVEVMQKLEAGC